MNSLPRHYRWVEGLTDRLNEHVKQRRYAEAIALLRRIVGRPLLAHEVFKTAGGLVPLYLMSETCPRGKRREFRDLLEAIRPHVAPRGERLFRRAVRGAERPEWQRWAMRFRLYRDPIDPEAAQRANAALEQLLASFGHSAAAGGPDQTPRETDDRRQP